MVQLEQGFGPVDGEPRDELYRGDSLAVLAQLLNQVRANERERVDLIYLDPPFCSGADYNRTIRLRGPEGRGRSLVHPQYADNWTTDDYLQFMYERLSACHELLSERGALFLHCDWHQSHRLRCVLDELFGPEQFQNEIVWHYYNKLQGNVGRFAANHDSILFYTKSAAFDFNRIRERRVAPVRQIKRVWSKDQRSLVNAKDPDGKLTYVTATHKTIDDVWRLPMLQPADRTEAVGYPTQKPEALLERIITAASNPGDCVLDPFMGSGTTAAVAVKLGRTFIGADVSGSAVHTSLRRLLRVREAIASGRATIKNGLDHAITPRRDAGLDVYAVAVGGALPPEPEPTVELTVADDRLVVRSFRPLAPLGLLAGSLEGSGEGSGEGLGEHWRALVDSIFIDPRYDGAVLRPTILDLPSANDCVRGIYGLPAGAGPIAVRIVDLLGRAWTGVLAPEIR